MRYYKLIISTIMILVLSTAMHATAASIPLMIPYSGTIAVDGAPFNGDGQFKFAIINGHADCQAIPNGPGCVTSWSNDSTSTSGSEPTNSVSIPVSNGNFAVKIGDSSLTNMQTLPEGIFDNPTTYLRIWFNDGVKGPQLISPDRQLVSVPYAFRADVADKYTGTIGSSQITAGAVGSTQINKAQVQSRVSQTCSPGLSIREIKEDGTVTCENDDGTSYTAGTGISISGNAISINNTQAQSRVSGTCAAGSSIRTVNQDGTVVCETDDVGAAAYIAGTGIDSTALSTGTIKIADGGVGSTQINNTQVQGRVTGTCAAGSSIRTVNADGTVVCDTGVSVTKYFSIPIWGMSKTAWTDFQGQWNGTSGLTYLGGNSYFDIPVYLPHGSSIEEFTAYVYDADATNGLYLSLHRSLLNSPYITSTLSSLSSTGSSGAQTLTNVLTTPHVVVNDTSGYSIRISLANSLNVGIFGIRIKYSEIQ